VTKTDFGPKKNCDLKKFKFRDGSSNHDGEASERPHQKRMLLTKNDSEHEENENSHWATVQRDRRAVTMTRVSPQAAALEEIYGPAARALSLAALTTRRGRPLELNPCRTAAPRGCRRQGASGGAGPPPAGA
jgi:hypothetical protein